MSESILDFLNLFIEPPGDILYFLVVIVVSQAGLFMVIGQRMRSAEHHVIQRYLLAMVGIGMSWLVLLVGSLLVLLAEQDSLLILPPLERATSIITILLLGWVVLTADHLYWSRISNIALLVFASIILIGYGYNAILWVDLAPSTDFNLSYFGIGWAFVGLLFSSLGFILSLVLFRIVWDAPLKMVMFLILSIGYGVTLYQTLEGTLIGNYSGASRLAFSISLLVALAIIYRMVINQLQKQIANTRISASRIAPAPARIERPTKPPVARMETGLSPVENQSVQLLRLLGMIVEAQTPHEIPQQIVKAALDVLRADVGALLRFQDANFADITEAYDRNMSREIQGLSLNLDSQPTLVNALERQSQRVLYVDRNHDELQDLFTRLDIEQTGPVYFQPLTRDKALIAVLMIALPYSERELSSSEIELLKGVGIVASKLLALSYAAEEASAIAEERAIQAMVEGVSPDDLDESDILAARQELQQSLNLAREQIGRLSKQVMELKLQLDDERTKVISTATGDDESLSISQRIVALQHEQQQLREERDNLSKRLQEAETTLTTATASSNKEVVHRLIESFRKEKDYLTSERERLQQQIEDLHARDKVMLPGELQQLVNNILLESNTIAAERDQINEKLDSTLNQLNALGIEDGVTGLTQLIAKFYAERTNLQNTIERLQSERNVLLNEREWFVENIDDLKEFEGRIDKLRSELKHVAADREAITKQRDKWRSQYDELRDKLDVVKEHRARLLAQASGFELELQEAYGEQAQLRTQIQELADTRSTLKKEYDRLVAHYESAKNERDQLIAQQEGDKRRTDELAQAGVHSLKEMIDTLTEERNQLEQQLSKAQVTIQEIEAKVEKQLQASNGNEQIDHYAPNNPDLLLGMVQELRTPMTSISGYINLLLSESAGIIGEMQRKFLQRVSANISRLTVMIDDLVRVTQLDTGQFKLEPEPIDLINLVEDAITNASTQFREKGLRVDLALDDQLPAITADRDAMNQIIGQLLTNAYLVSPPESELMITVKQQIMTQADGSPVDSILFSIEDRGGGILDEDVPRVFARKYKAENPLIDGLGDTGVGLSIAKALVEEHSGKLWVESKQGVGSIFSISLPLKLETAKE